MTQKVKKNILKLKESSTLAINERSKELIKSGKKIYRFGFGQSPFQIPENIVDVYINYVFWYLKRRLSKTKSVDFFSRFN